MNNIYNFLKDKVDFYFDTPVSNIEILGDDKGYIINTEKESYECEKCIVSVGRSGSKWMEKFAMTLKFRQNLTELTLVFVLSFLL